MTDFNYKKYSLEHLENWMHDAMSSAEAKPQEIYDVIIGVVKEEYYYHKDQASRAYELLALLNGNGEELYDAVVKEREYYEGKENNKSWDSFWESKEDKVVKWKLPVEVDDASGDYYIQFPDDLLEAANLKEGDQVEWVDNNDGSFTLKKVTEPLGMDEC